MKYLKIQLSQAGSLGSGGGGGGATSFPTDSGTATEAGGILNILGSGTVTTSASGNTVTVTGAGGGSGALVLIQTQTATNATTLDFTTGISSTYNNYLLIMDNMSFDPIASFGATGLFLSLSTDGGGTWITTNYAQGFIGLNVVNSTNCFGGTYAGTTFSLNQTMDILNLTSGNATGYITSIGNQVGYDTTMGGPIVQPYSYNTFDVYMTTGTAVNALQLIIDGVLVFNGTFSLYGYTK